jgi:hypothetical protein
VDDMNKPVLTEVELWEYLHYDEGLPVTRRSIKHAVIRREIVPTRLGNCNFFSKRDGLDWIASRRQTGVYRAKSGAAQ